MYFNTMLMYEPAHFIKTFVTDLDAALGKLKPNAKLTHTKDLAGILFDGNVADQFSVLGEVRACELGRL